MSSAAVSGGGGLVFNSPVCRAFNRTGATVVKGQLVQFDLALSSTEATGFVVAGSTTDPEADGFSNVVTPYDETAGIFAIALEDIDDNKSGRFQLEGIVRDAKVLYLSSTNGGVGGTDVQQGTIVGCATGVDSTQAEDFLHASAANNTKALGITLGFITDQTAITRVPVYFNGYNGIGTPHS